MGIPPDSIVSLTLSRMQKSLEQRIDVGDVSHERSGLLFVGNVHDAFPRRLFLDIPILFRMVNLILKISDFHRLLITVSGRLSKMVVYGSGLPTSRDCSRH